MAEDENYIDLSKETQLTDWDIVFIKENPEGLTKEGVEYMYDLWVHSGNKYRKLTYKTMLAYTKSHTKSGKTKDGKVILSRDKITNKPTWAEFPKDNVGLEEAVIIEDERKS